MSLDAARTSAYATLKVAFVVDCKRSQACPTLPLIHTFVGCMMDQIVTAK